MYAISLCASLLDNMCLYCFTMAYALDSSGFVALISYMRIFWAYAADLLFFDDEIKVSQLLSALVIIVVAGGVTLYKLMSTKKEN